jgi:hypothetical protein
MVCTSRARGERSARALRERELVRCLVSAFPDATIAPIAAVGSCSYSEQHAAAHWPHPVTGRPTCFVCHPPPGVRP